MKSTILHHLKRFYNTGTVLVKLLLINAIVFIGLGIVKVFLFLFKIPSDFIGHVFSLPSSLSGLLYKPWTFITYMFTHFDFLHFAMNMLVLYFSGKLFLMFLSEKRMMSTYVLGGIAGGILFVLFFNVFPSFSEQKEFSSAVGASASIIAILVAVATYQPDYKVSLFFVGAVPLKYIAIVYVVIDFLQIPGSNSGGHIAHIGGAIWGFIYIQQLKKGKDYSYDFMKPFGGIVSYFKNKKSMKVVHRKKKTTDDYEYNASKKKQQDEIDAILDKISKSGYDSLSKAEKQQLFNYSNE